MLSRHLGSHPQGGLPIRVENCDEEGDETSDLRQDRAQIETCEDSKAPGTAGSSAFIKGKTSRSLARSRVQTTRVCEATRAVLGQTGNDVRAGRCKVGDYTVDNGGATDRWAGCVTIKAAALQNPASPGFKIA